jgi:protein SCO1/2
MSRLPLIVTGVVLVCGAVGATVVAAARARTAEAGLPERPFALTDHQGRPFTHADLRGKITLLYFGYTFCPDVCPTELGYVGRLMRALGPEADQVRPVMVSIDPERDTPVLLAGFVSAFDPRLVGLTGSPDDIRSLAKAYGVFAQRANVATAKPGFYLMDHTSTTFLLDRQGRQQAKIDSHTTPIDTAVAAVRGLLASSP